MSELMLNQVIVGLGNPVFEQFHRTNRVDIPQDEINNIITQRFNGGITGATINACGIKGGGLSHQPNGVVNIEGGWNQRRGLALLQFTVTDNSLQVDKLAVLGYLAGGGASYLGVIPDDVLFVPVRSWTVSETSRQDGDYMPVTAKTMTESSQFLMNDPDAVANFQSVRPVDVVNYGMGLIEAEENDRGGSYAGTTNSDIGNNGIVISKGGNLDPLAAANQVIHHAARVASNMNTHNSLSENMAYSIGGMQETETFQHPFLGYMMSELGLSSYAGFVGFSFGELRQCFMGFDTVVSPPSDRNTGEVNHMLTSSQLGSANYDEIIANEIAFIALHSMIDNGLLYLEFVASNNVSNMSINRGDIYFQAGSAAGVIPNDQYLAGRVESFKNYIANSFFQKYAVRQWGNATPISLSVKMNVFGECVVELSLNGDERNRIQKVFTSYTLNRTSSNIANTEQQKLMAENHVENIQQYFSNQGN